MKIETLMTREVRTCAPNDNLNTAAHLMWAGDCGAVPVVDADGRLVGIVTDRDLCMAAHLNGARLDQLVVADVMASKVHCLEADAPVHDALEILRDQQLRRLPVVDDQGRVVGLLSLADLARAWAQHVAVEGRELRADDVAYTLAGICRDRSQTPRTLMVVEVAAERGEAEPTAAPALPKRKPTRKSKGGAKKPRKGARGRS